MGEEQNSRTEYYTSSPTEVFKKELLRLVMENIHHNSKSRNIEEKYAFCTMVKDLSILFERFTPEKTRVETRQWYKQLDEEVDKLQADKGTSPQQKEQMILDLRYRYGEKVHQQNERILLNSPILEVQGTARIVMDDEGAINRIRGEVSSDDDGSIV